MSGGHTEYKQYVIKELAELVRKDVVLANAKKDGVVSNEVDDLYDVLGEEEVDSLTEKYWVTAPLEELALYKHLIAVHNIVEAYDLYMSCDTGREEFVETLKEEFGKILIPLASSMAELIKEPTKVKEGAE